MKRREAGALSEHHRPAARGTDVERLGLRSDCASCFGLCCVALPFAASADFAIDKPAGRPCPNLRTDSRCDIHGQLRERGFPGCVAYECFGAGQRVSQLTFGGEDWRVGSADTARRMFEVFPIMRQLHELLWYLAEALTLRPAGPLHARLRRAMDKTERLARGTPDALAEVDVAAHRQGVSVLLRRVSELVRAGAPGSGRTRRGGDLIGADLRGADLRGADLRGALLIGTDLRRADLRMADLIGADMRAADLGGADLAESIFLTQPQLDAAKGDATTRLPAALRRPAHWLQAHRSSAGGASNSSSAEGASNSSIARDRSAEGGAAGRRKPRRGRPRR